MAKDDAPSTPGCPASHTQMMEHIRRISTLEAGIAGLGKNIDEIKQTVHRTDKAIRGNDRPGLMARTASLEDSRDEQEETQKSDRRWRRGVWAGIIVAFVTAGLGLTVSFALATK